MEDTENIDTLAEHKSLLEGNPSPQQQSWGLLISIVLIVLMVTVGAFYAWGKRIAEQQALQNQAAAAAAAAP